MATTSVELPCGYESKGLIHRTAEIRRMKGRVQRDVALLSSKKNPDPAEILEAVLYPNLVSLAGEKVTKGMLLRTLLADRDFLLLEMVKMLRGSVVETTEECPATGCGQIIEISDINLDELEVTPLPDDVPWWGPNGLVSADAVPNEDDSHFRVFVLENEDLGVKAVFRYPRGQEQRRISKLADKPLEAVWKLMAITCVSWKCPDHDVPKPPKGGFSSTFWDDVDYEILEWIEAEFAAAQPGVDTRIDVECPSCGLEFKTQVAPLHFLLRKPRRDKSES